MGDSQLERGNAKLYKGIGGTMIYVNHGAFRLLGNYDHKITIR